MGLGVAGFVRDRPAVRARGWIHRHCWGPQHADRGAGATGCSRVPARLRGRGSPAVSARPGPTTRRRRTATKAVGRGTTSSRSNLPPWCSLRVPVAWWCPALCTTRTPAPSSRSARRTPPPFRSTTCTRSRRHMTWVPPAGPRTGDRVRQRHRTRVADPSKGTPTRRRETPAQRNGCRPTQPGPATTSSGTSASPRRTGSRSPPRTRNMARTIATCH